MHSRSIWCSHAGGLKSHAFLNSRFMFRVSLTQYSKTMSVVAKPDISIWLPKPEIITSLELWQIASKKTRSSNAKFWIFDDDELGIRLAKWFRQRSTTRNCKIGAQNVYIAISGCRSLSQSWSTRKPSWRKGKRATAVRVWRPLAKKSTANLQAMVNRNRGRITYGLRIAGYFRVYRLKITIFTHDIVIVDPLAEERPAIYQRNLCIAASTGLSSFVLPLYCLSNLRNHAKFRENSNL